MASSRELVRSESAEIDVALTALLESTAALAHQLEQDFDASNLAEAYETRRESFELLRSVLGGKGLENAAQKQALAEILLLDSRILRDTQLQSSELKEERAGLSRARRAIGAHAKRGRGEPRLLAVRA